MIIGKCKFCGRDNENNPGDYYHYHYCWSKDVLKRIEQLKATKFDPIEMQKLERELEMARYVGD